MAVHHAVAEAEPFGVCVDVYDVVCAQVAGRVLARFGEVADPLDDALAEGVGACGHAAPVCGVEVRIVAAV